MKASVNCTSRKYVCASERVKLIGDIDGMFPDFGHHQENEMGGLWLHPIKLLSGFWMRFRDYTAKTVDCWITADSFTNYPYGNKFEYNHGLGHTEIEIQQFQFAPEEAAGLIIDYVFKNTGAVTRRLGADFLARTDIRPVWFSETVGVYPGAQDELSFDRSGNAFHAKDSAHDWHVLIGSSEEPAKVQTGHGIFGLVRGNEKGTDGLFCFEFDLGAGEEKKLTFYIAGSAESSDDCNRQYELLKNGNQLLQNKKRRYDAIAALTDLTVEDKNFEEIFRWIKFNNDWLILNVPGFGRGLSAGLPEYPWWFGCDNCYALQGVLATGNFALCRDTILLLLDHSEKINKTGRMLHELTTFGAVPNPGNIQETAHFIVLVWQYYQWTGDWSLMEHCIPYLKKSVQYLIEADADGDFFPSGYGIIEIAHLNMELIDSAVYTCKAFEYWSEICRIKGWQAESAKFSERALQMREAFNRMFWSEKDGIYCDAVAPNTVIREHLETIFEKAAPEKQWYAKEQVLKTLAEKEACGTTKSGWILHKNWVITTPMEMEIAPDELAQSALDKLNTEEYVGPYGMYLSGLYGGEIMTISTGVLAVSQARYGHADRAKDLLDRMFSSFSMATPGSISEMSPDYGCFVQAWTLYAAAVPVVTCFFGIQPNAALGRIELNPQMPTAWKKASLRAVRVLDGELSISYVRNGETETYHVENRSTAPVFCKIKDGQTASINGSAVQRDESGYITVSAQNAIFAIEITRH